MEISFNVDYYYRSSNNKKKRKEKASFFVLFFHNNLHLFTLHRKVLHFSFQSLHTSIYMNNEQIKFKSK